MLFHPSHIGGADYGCHDAERIRRFGATGFVPCSRGNILGIPADVLPLALIKPVSGSGATALLTQIFAKDGPDSFAGRVASVMAGSTETTFYCIAVYYGAVQIKKTRHTIPAALFADLTAFFVAGLAVRLFFWNLIGEEGRMRKRKETPRCIGRKSKLWKDDVV